MPNILLCVDICTATEQPTHVMCCKYSATDTTLKNMAGLEIETSTRVVQKIGSAVTYVVYELRLQVRNSERTGKTVVTHMSSTTHAML